MMFSHLKPRLLLTYAVLIIVMICMMGTGILFSISTSPIFFHQEVENLRNAEADSRIIHSELFPDGNPKKNIVDVLASEYQIRILLLDDKGTVIQDTDAELKIPMRKFPKVISRDNISTAKVIRDRNGRVWFYLRHSFADQSSVVFAIRRPVASLRLLLRDELFRPLFLSAFLALLASIVISIIMGRWILDPLMKISNAAKVSADGKYQAIPINGPKEVQELAVTLNEMNYRVHDSLQSQRSFMANVSHELKTPLTSIQGYAQAIIDGTAGSIEKIKNSAEIIHSEAIRMSRLVTDLLSLAKLEGGTAELNLEQGQLTPLIESTINRLKPLADNKRISISVDLKHQSKILCDSDSIIQVFTNLLDNAIKFSPEGETIQIDSSENNEGILISFTDHGPGILVAEKEKIFDRFYQSEKIEVQKKKHGFGLGLAIARQIVLAHKGELWVESNPGSGSKFHVRFPVV